MLERIFKIFSRPLLFPPPYLQGTLHLVKGQPETLGLASLIEQALDQLGWRASSDSCIHVVKSGVLAAVVPWSELSVLQVKTCFLFFLFCVLFS